MDVNLAAHFAFQRYFNRVFHKFITPMLDSFSRYPVLPDADTALKQLVVSDEVIQSPKFKDEFECLSLVLSERYKQINLNYPLAFATETQSSYFLYSLVRVLKPITIVETGVANGHSTFYLLNALLKNEKGTLYSFDVNGDVGGLISENDKKLWDLNILPGGRKKTAFLDRINKLGDIDIFIHDSNHFYYWQIFEYRTAWEKVKNGGFLISDDVNASYAFLDFSEEISVKPTFISDSRKMFGILVKGSK